MFIDVARIKHISCKYLAILHETVLITDTVLIVFHTIFYTETWCKNQESNMVIYNDQFCMVSIQ